MLELNRELRKVDLFERELIRSSLGDLYNPLRMSLTDGDLAVVDDYFTYRQYNDFLTNFSAAGAIGNPQAGTIQHITGTDLWKGYRTAASWADFVMDPLLNELDAAANSIGFTEQTATGDGTTTVDWRLGNKFFFTFGAFNETFTFTAPTKVGNFILVLKQDATGSRTATWPATCKWPNGSAPVLSTAASAIDIIAFYYAGDGNYYGVNSLNFS